MRNPKSVLGAVLLGAGLLVLVGCKKKDERPPRLDEGDTGGEGAAGAGEGAAGTTGGAGAAGEMGTAGDGAAGEAVAGTGTAGGAAGGGGVPGGGSTARGGAAGGGAAGSSTGGGAGAATGGAQTGGEAVGGGTETGGDENGGSTSGGAETGGAATGGVGTGGDATGGAETGGTATGGDEPGTGGDMTAGAGGAGGAEIPVGDPCLGHQDCTLDNQYCFFGVTTVRSCREYCDAAGIGTDEGCREGELCTLYAYGAAGACLKTCTPYVTPSECPETEWCLPNPPTSYTGGVAVDGLCVEEAAGASEGGESCEGVSCAGGYYCYHAAGTELGYDVCQPLCDPEAAAGTLGACAEGSVCRAAFGSTTSSCVTLCDPFGAASCGAGEHCVAYQELDGEALVLEGHCVDPGTKALGEACADGECGAGLDCIEEPPPYGVGSSCRPVCDLGMASPCGTAASCLPITRGDTGLGTCEPSCTLFGEGVAAGCVAEEWCAPTFLGGGAGTCVAVGAAAIGETCTAGDDCGAGAYCDCRFGQTTGCFSARICTAACLPGAATGDPEGCASGQTCVRPSVWGGQPASFGLCREPCDADGAATCSDETETCVAGELLADGVDACIDVPPAAAAGEYCFVVGIDEGDPCGPTNLCLALSGDGNAICVDVCRFSEGGVGTTDHPDCAEATDSCEQIAAGLDYGRCVAP